MTQGGGKIKHIRGALNPILLQKQMVLHLKPWRTLFDSRFKPFITCVSLERD